MIYNIPTKLYYSLNKEQIALLELLEDPDPDVFLGVSQRILEYGDSLKQVLGIVYDYADVMQQDMLKERSKHLLRSMRIKDIGKLDLKGDLDIDSFLQVILLIDELYLLKNLEREFIIDELEGMKKQLWLSTNFYMTEPNMIKSIHSVFYNILNFSDIGSGSRDQPVTFIESMYNRSASEFIQFLSFKIMSEFMEIYLVPMVIDDRYLLGWINPNTNLFEMVLEFPAGQMYYKELLPKYFTQEELFEGRIGTPRHEKEAIIHHYIDYLLERSNPEDEDLIEALRNLSILFEEPPY